LALKRHDGVAVARLDQLPPDSRLDHPGDTDTSGEVKGGSMIELHCLRLLFSPAPPGNRPER
jgi:hypothetical protein